MADVDLSGWMPANTYVRYTAYGVTVRIVEMPSPALPDKPMWTVKVGGVVEHHAFELRAAVLWADRMAEEDHDGWGDARNTKTSADPPCGRTGKDTVRKTIVT